MHFKSVILVAASLVLAGVAWEYVVTKESDFYSTLYKTSPGDTIDVQCDIRQGFIIDQGGDYYRSLTIKTTTGATIGSLSAVKDLSITAPNVRLTGFRLNDPLSVKAQSVVLENLSAGYIISIQATRVLMTNCTARKVSIVGSNNQITKSVLTSFDIKGNDNTINNNAILMKDCSSNITGDSNELVRNAFTDSQFCGENSFVLINATSTSFKSNEFVVNSITSTCYYLRNKVVFEFGGQKNMYNQNTCVYKKKAPGGETFVYVLKDPGNDRVCASNSVDEGDISNIPIDRRC